MNHSLFTHPELIGCEQMHQRWLRAVVSAVPMAGVTVLLALGLIFSGGVEYALSYEIFAYLKAPLPGEVASWSVALFALTGVLMALAFHLYANEHPDARAVRLLQLSVSILVPLYALGAGLALAAILYFDGADALFTAPAAATMELFSAGMQETGSPLLEKFVANFALIFVLGCGGLAIITLYIFHKLASLIRRNVQDLTSLAFAAKTAREAMATIRTCDREFTTLSREREGLAAHDPRASELSFANSITAFIQAELAPTERWLLDQQFKVKTPECRFLPREDGGKPDLKAIEKRVAALRAIDARTIAVAFHPENNTRSKS